MNRDHCALCGEKRRATEPQVKSFGMHDLLIIREHRELQPGRAEQSPQMMIDTAIYASIRRNGGESEDTHLCQGCIRLGLQRIKEFCEESLK